VSDTNSEKGSYRVPLSGGLGPNPPRAKVGKATIFLCRVDAYPLEFSERERDAFSNTHPDLHPQARINYLLSLLQDAGHCTVIVFPTARHPRLRVKSKRGWIEIL
jgi:hypothetical protein